MADNRVQGEWVHCHQCDHNWPRAEGGLTCPQCAGEFVEILDHPPEPDAPARDPFSSTPDRFDSPQPNPLNGHDPWGDDPPDPDEGDISTWEFSSRPGATGTFSFSARTVRGPALGGRRRIPVDDPEMADSIADFENLLTNVLGGQPAGRNARNDPQGFPPLMGGIFPFPGFGGPQGQQAGFQQHPFPPPRGFEQGPRVHIHTGGNASIQDLFSMMFNAMGPMNAGGPAGQARGPDGMPANPFAILQQLMNPANAQSGDAVFSQEALDRVISQLMEQNQGSTAPPPASEAAIESLPTKKIDKGMMGNDGKAECSICMDNVELGEEVTVLPCFHWFHQACVTAWLKEHDTCPHCRKGISTPPGQERSQSARPDAGDRRPSTASRQSYRRSSSVNLRNSPGPEGSMRNPFMIPDSPSDVRARRQRYFDRQQSGTERQNSGSSRMSAYEETRRGDGSGGSRNSSGSNSGNNGGVTGWIRNHNPFSG